MLVLGLILILAMALWIVERLDRIHEDLEEVIATLEHLDDPPGPSRRR
jgi:hypothetical protein